MMYTLVIYLFTGITSTGTMVYDPDVPIIVLKNLTVADCQNGLEVIEDTRIVTVNGVSFVFDTDRMAAFCEPEA